MLTQLTWGEKVVRKSALANAMLSFSSSRREIGPSGGGCWEGCPMIRRGRIPALEP